MQKPCTFPQGSPSRVYLDVERIHQPTAYIHVNEVAPMQASAFVQSTDLYDAVEP
jgi:hypothetical protein